MDAQWFAFGLAAVLLLGVYLLQLNSFLSSAPKGITALSPDRFDSASVKEVHGRLLKNPIVVDFPPKTGRRYIVVGGAGFLPGWIVLQLLARGEDPKRIRIVDIRAPNRQDMKTNVAAEVPFFKADVADIESVMHAFSAPWPSGAADNVPITVFHSAANIRFWERAEFLLPLSNRVNLEGTRNVVAACIKIGASILIYTSSASITIERFSFWLWPLKKYRKKFVQVLDDDAQIPTKHNKFFSNYAASKAAAERCVREADRTVIAHGVLRTGCIRPGNGVYGPGADALVGAYLVEESNLSWVGNIIQSFSYVENCALSHLLYEQRLLEMDKLKRPDIGGQAFNITDPNPPISFGDVYVAMSTLTSTRFTKVPPVLIFALAHALEAYYLLRIWYPPLSSVLPEIKGKIMVLQPSLFSLIQIHLVFDDSRARKSPEEGGLGFKAPWTSIEGLCQLVIHWEEGKKNGMLPVGGHLSLGLGVETNWVQKWTNPS